MIRQRIAAWPFPVAAGIFMLVAAIALAGCGGGSGGGDTAEGAAPAAAAGGDGGAPSAEQEEQLLAYADCLREHGMEVNVDGGRFQMRGGGTDRAAAEEAQEACRDLAPEGMGAGATASPEQKQEMLEYIQCLRGEGIELSDPDPATGSPQGEDARKFMDPDADMEAAMEACQDVRPSRMMIRAGEGSE